MRNACYKSVHNSFELLLELKLIEIANFSAVGARYFFPPYICDTVQESRVCHSVSVCVTTLVRKKEAANVLQQDMKLHFGAFLQAVFWFSFSTFQRCFIFRWAKK